MSINRSFRRGSAYVLVIIVMAVVGAVVLSSLQIARGRDGESGLVTDSFQASQYARSAIEAGLDTINSDPNWRWTKGDGAWRTGVATDRGTLDLSVTGADGAALGLDAWQPVKVTGTGQVGLSRSILEVQVGLQGQGVPEVGEVIFGNGGLAYWAFGGDATEAAADRVQGNAAELVDGAEPLRAGAIPGLGASSAPWFTAGAHAKIQLGGDYGGIRSISLWFWADEVSSTQGLVIRDSTTLKDGSWSLYLKDGILYGRVVSAAGDEDISSPVTARQWHHVVLTLGDSQGVLYLDGQPVSNSATKSLNYWDASRNTEIIYAGVSHSGSEPGSDAVDVPFTGSICHLSLMAQPLTATEVKQLYDGYPSPAGYKVLADTWNRATD